MSKKAAQLKTQIRNAEEIFRLATAFDDATTLLRPQMREAAKQLTKAEWVASATKSIQMVSKVDKKQAEAIALAEYAQLPPKGSATHRITRDRWHLMIPTTVADAFSVELYLKALLHLETGAFPGTHNV